jgi:hypothetical protein
MSQLRRFVLARLNNWLAKHATSTDGFPAVSFPASDVKQVTSEAVLFLASLLRRLRSDSWKRGRYVEDHSDKIASTSEKSANR